MRFVCDCCHDLTAFQMAAVERMLAENKEDET